MCERGGAFIDDVCDCWKLSILLIIDFNLYNHDVYQKGKVKTLGLIVINILFVIANFG